MNTAQSEKLQIFKLGVTLDGHSCLLCVCIIFCAVKY